MKQLSLDIAEIKKIIGDRLSDNLKRRSLANLNLNYFVPK